MEKLKNYQIARKELLNLRGGAGPYDPSAADPSLIPNGDGTYAKYTGGNQSCSNGVNVVRKDRETYNGAGDLITSVEVYIHNGGL